MLITVVTETYWPEVNGVAMTLFRLVNGLVKRGHQIQLVCPCHANRCVDELSSKVHYLPVRGVSVPGYNEVNIGFPSRKRLKQMWRSDSPDVIYVATEGPLGWAAVKEANRCGIPIISGFHTNFHSYSRHYRLGFMESIVERYLATIHNKTRTTVVPTHEQKIMLETMGVLNVDVMGRGVDTDLFSPLKRDPALRGQWGVENHEPVMIYVGRIAEEKNLDLTIRTYYSLREINEKLKFVLVGDGPLLKKMKKDHPSFIFSGMQTGEALAAHYASGDIFAFTSLTETFGNVILEAMASGLGVVAYDYAAARLHIQPGENGLRAKLNDQDDFLHTAKQLVQNDVLLKKLRNNAGKYALQHNWESVVEQFETILQSHSIDGLPDWEERFEAGQQSH
jgi:glycosyltransferase involved in cell wall biosynthesis